MSRSQLAAVAYLARYSGHTHSLYAYQLRRWFEWCETNRLDPLDGIQRAHVELYIRHLGGRGLMPSSINTMMHGVRGFFRFAHIDGLIPSDPAVYARLPKIHTDESRTQGLDRLEPIRFLQVAQTISVHHGALAFLLGINALRASEAAAVRIEDYRDTLSRAPGAAIGRQGQQAGHHAADRPGPAGPRGLPGGTDRGAAGAPAGLG
jgi:site-specific recombinase XerD